MNSSYTQLCSEFEDGVKFWMQNTCKTTLVLIKVI